LKNYQKIKVNYNLSDMYHKLQLPYINGWLVIDKPSGIGSTNIVNLVKKKVRSKKVGHGGTLDPDATGLLPIAIGEATKTIRFTENLLKTYEFTVTFGSCTDTDDSSGKIIGTSEKRPSMISIRQALKKFKGEIQQLPPKLSAIKINGRRAYDLFHKGLEFQLSPRKIFISEIEIIERIDNENINLKIICGKGCYVRSLARDLGNELGCFAHARNIRRTEYGPFNLKKCVHLDALKYLKEDDLKANIFTINILLKDYPNFECATENLNIISNGNPVKIINMKNENYDLAWTHYKNIPLAIGKIENSVFYPFRVLNIYKNINN
tara:strand:+ start:145 stop:1110 length:966 start_codon:yes stop_codon:yes gene_type:complete